MLINSDNLFLISARVTLVDMVPYTNDRSFDEQMIVIADNKEQAKQKYINNWKNKFSNFREINHIGRIEITPVLS